MSEQEFNEFVEGLKEQGLSEEDILGIFYKAFEEGELGREDLDIAAKAMGYQAKKEFMEDPDLDEGGGEPDEGDDGSKGLDKDQIEAAKEFKEGESEDDFKERVAEGEKADDDDEDDERKEAMSYFD